MLYLQLDNVSSIVKVDKYNYDWNYVYSHLIILNNEDIASRIADVVVDECYKKNLDVGIVTRKIWKESRGKQHAISY